MFATTLYGVFGGSTVNASLLIISRLSKFPTVSFKTGKSVSSSSIDVTFFAVLHSSFVKTPRPGPTSIIWSVFFILAAFIISPRAVKLTKKFWPIHFFAHRLCLCSSFFISLKFVSST